MFARNLQRKRLLILGKTVQQHLIRGGSVTAFVASSKISRARVYRALNYAIRLDHDKAHDRAEILDLPMVYVKRDRRHTDPVQSVKPIDPLLD